MITYTILTRKCLKMTKNGLKMKNINKYINKNNYESKSNKK